VLELFQKALLYNDTKKLYFALLGIYENPKQPQGVQHDMADQLLKTMTRKFNTSAKVTFFAADWHLDRSVNKCLLRCNIVCCKSGCNKVGYSCGSLLSKNIIESLQGLLVE
jgi:hypothetical protein